MWPQGVVGSIAHTAGLAGAIATRNSHFSGIGLDIEQLQVLDELSHEICTDRENEAERESFDGAHYLNVVFSAKEAVYKCLWPQVRRFIGFHEIEIALNADSGEFAISWHKNVHDNAHAVRGWWRMSNNVIAAVATLPSSIESELT